MQYTEDFETFWVKYPSRWNRDLGRYIKRRKRPAFVKWQTLYPEIKQECLRKVHLIKQYEGSAVRDCVTWLNQYGWEDIAEPKKKSFISKNIASKILKESKTEKVNINNARNRLERELLKADGKDAEKQKS